MNIENIKEENDIFDPFFVAPNPLITAFADEMREAGLEFDECDELSEFMPEKKDVILPQAVKYYREAREEQNDEAENYFLSFFEYKGLDELVPMLIEAYTDANTWDVTRWGIADCLSAIESKEYAHEYIEAVSNSALGSSRQKLIALLGKIKDERAIPALIELLEDKTVRAHTLAALSKFDDPELRSHFERFKDDENPGVRKCALDALGEV